MTKTKKLFAVLGGLALAVPLAVLPALPANAATTVSVTVGNHNCRLNGQYSGSVSRILIDVVPSLSGQPGWLSGRTRSGISIPTPSAAGRPFTVAGKIFCKTNIFGGGYYRDVTFGRWHMPGQSTSWTF